MVSAGVITSISLQSPSLHMCGIIREFTAGIEFMRKRSQVEKHCTLFLFALEKMNSGSFTLAAKSIAEEWIEDCKSKCKVTLHLSV